MSCIINLKKSHQSLNINHKQNANNKHCKVSGTATGVAKLPSFKRWQDT